MGVGWFTAVGWKSCKGAQPGTWRTHGGVVGWMRAEHRPSSESSSASKAQSVSTEVGNNQASVIQGGRQHGMGHEKGAHLSTWWFMKFPTGKLNQEQEGSRSRNFSRKEVERQPSSIREEGQRIEFPPIDHGSEARLQPLGRTDKGKQKERLIQTQVGDWVLGRLPQEVPGSQESMAASGSPGYKVDLRAQRVTCCTQSAEQKPWAPFPRGTESPGSLAEHSSLGQRIPADEDHGGRKSAKARGRVC